MALSGQAKTDYQREYMRRRRSNTRSNQPAVRVRPAGHLVRPKELDLVRPDISVEEQMQPTGLPKPEPQSYNSMKVGYVPPEE